MPTFHNNACMENRAQEWQDLPYTSSVDVYSLGIVLLDASQRKRTVQNILDVVDSSLDPHPPAKIVLPPSWYPSANHIIAMVHA